MSDVSTKMLNAILGKKKKRVLLTDRNGQLDYIMRYVDTLTIEEKKVFCKCILSMQPNFFKEHPNGCICNLERLEPETLNEAYKIVEWYV